jgi:hypothetical protein
MFHLNGSSTANSTELLLSQICVVPCLGKERLNLQDIFSSVDNQKIPETYKNII